MEQKKVRLPREVAEALEKAKDQFENMPEQVAWCIPDESMEAIHGDHWKVLHDYANTTNGGFFRLVDAIRYGYEPEPEPITIVITPEMQEQIKTWYEAHQEDADRHYRIGFVTALGLCGIKISGVNE